MALRDQKAAANEPDGDGSRPGSTSFERWSDDAATAVEAHSHGGAETTLTVALRAGAAHGARVGRYVLLDKLGAGAMGYVYTAHDPDLARQVALKLIRPELDGGDRGPGSARDRLLREAQAAARLKHPNVVTVYETGEASRVAYIAMELVEGQSLRDWMQATPASERRWREVLDVFLQCGEGLAAAHEAGVLHRDFKPDNVLIDRRGRAKVADFGLAAPIAGRLAEASSQTDDAADESLPGRRSLEVRMTQTGVVMGTPAYMAPEQHLSAQVDARADQYAFAASLYEALFGERPFRGRSVKALLLDKREGKVRTPTGRSSVPTWLRRVVLRGLSPDPADRWTSMESMLAALRSNPTPRRLGFASVALLAVAASGALGARAVERARIEQLCQDEGAAPRATWTEATRAQIERAFVDTGLHFAADSYARLVEAVDRFEARYATARTDLCRKIRLERSVRPEVASRAEECLDRSLDAFEAQIDAWRNADTDDVSRATGNARSLAELSHCTDLEKMARRVAIEDVGIESELLEALREGYRRGRQLAHEGDYEQSVAVAEQTAARAREAGAHSIASAAALTQCSSLQTLSKADEAYAACTRSYADAVRSSDHEGAFHTAAALASLVSQHRRDFDEANLWLDIAEATHALDAIEDGSPDANLARLLTVRGYVALDAGRHDEAVDWFSKATPAHERASGRYSEAVLDSLVQRSYVEQLRANDAEAKEALTEAREVGERVFGPSHPRVIDLVRQEAGLLHELDPSRVDEAYAELLALTPATQTPSMNRAMNLTDWGRSLENRGRCDEGLPKLREAYEIVQATPDAQPPWLAQMLVVLAKCADEGGSADEASAALERAVAIVGDDVAAAGRAFPDVHRGAGRRALAQGDRDAAREHFELAWTVAEKQYGAELAREYTFRPPDEEMGAVLVADRGD